MSPPPCRCPPDWLFHSPLCPLFDCMHDPASHGTEEPDYMADLASDWRDGDTATRDTYPPIGD